MSEAKKVSRVSGRKRRLILVTLGSLVAGATLLVLWFAGVTLGNSDPIFKGKPESAWIKNLKYRDDDQVQEWRGYGAAGVQVLIRGLDHANRPGERAYRRLYRKIPWQVGRYLPDPKDDSTRASRMCMVSLLSSLGSDAESATPVMKLILTSDEDASVRQGAVNFFTGNEDAKSPLNRMSAAEKGKLLPALLRDLQNPGNWGLRNNVANALYYFPEHRDEVAPALVKALQDSEPHVRLLSATALNHIDPAAAKKAGAVAVVVAIMQESDDQIAGRAASALREFESEAEIAVPALIQGLENTNTLVACDSVWSLQQFKTQTNLIIPALEKAALRPDSPGRYAKAALKQFSHQPQPMQGAR